MKRYIIHCSDSEWGNASEITKWHCFPKEKIMQGKKSYQGNGWNHIGYHYIILNGWTSPGYFDAHFDGHLESGRNPEIDGAHTKGQNDATGICLIGRSGLFTDNQFLGLHKFFNRQRDIYGPIDIQQHSAYDLNKPHCAGLDLAEFKKVDHEGYSGTVYV